MCVYMYHPTPTTVCMCTQYPIPGIMTEKNTVACVCVCAACENLNGVKSGLTIVVSKKLKYCSPGYVLYYRYTHHRRYLWNLGTEGVAQGVQI